FFDTHTKDADFLNDIDGKVVSYEIHKIKPDPAIYEYLLEKYDLKPEESVFFDDRLENTEAAEKLGIKSYTITSKEYLLEVLDEYLDMK
ncbi:MAG: HAD-IA family hydrolase, partial [Lachnospiraceae bacterium]|nr:HAD-IA family hydrolase [Lachnospiraceae bacterium]